MDKETVAGRLNIYLEAVREYFDVKMMILYGSYAKGNERADSDIDVAVVVDSLKEDILTSEAKLCRLRRNIDDRIQPILLESQNDKSGFLEDIIKTGTLIYKQ